MPPSEKKRSETKGRTAARSKGGASPRNKQASSGESSKTRKELIEATIRMIGEVGIGNTNSSEVARRIGATWSVIQYHFGTWEALLLGAIQQIADSNYETMQRTIITGDTVFDRLSVYSDLVFQTLGAGRFAMATQIATFLLNKPTTHEATAQTIDILTSRQDAAMRVLLARVSPLLRESAELRTLILYAFSGMAYALDAGGEMYLEASTPERHPNRDRQRELLVRALTLLIEDEARKSAGE